MKIHLTLVYVLISVTGVCQSIPKSKTPIQQVSSIFKEFVTYSESTDSQSNKDTMTKALASLQKSPSSEKDLDLLVNVWMYYDPTDYDTRGLIEPIFYKNKTQALIAITKRLNKKEKWETEESAPYSDLILLKKGLSK